MQTSLMMMTIVIVAVTWSQMVRFSSRLPVVFHLLGLLGLIGSALRGGSFLVLLSCQVGSWLERAELCLLLLHASLNSVVGHMTVVTVHDTILELVPIMVVMLMTMHVLTIVDRVMIRWLHLEDKISFMSEGIRWVENAAILLECATEFVPAVLVKLIEIVAPGELKVVRVPVVVVGLHVVKQDVPGHVFRVQVGAPSVESRRPEVHA